MITKLKYRRLTSFSARILFLLLCFQFNRVDAQKEKLFTYFSLNGFYTHYISNSKHLTNQKSAIAFSVAAREEFRFSTIFSIVCGPEFFSHGLSYDSYYFKSDEIKLYDNSFSYHYRLRVNELNVPLLIRANYTEAHRERPTAYFEIGPALRWMFSSKLRAEDAGGAILFNGKTKPEFEFPLFNRYLNTFMQVNLGYHIYTKDKLTGFFVELNMRFAPIRFLVKEDFTASSLYFHNFHAGLGVGLRL